MDAKAVGARIERRRLELGISRAALAKAVEYTSAEPLRKVERGDTQASVEKLIAIASQLDVTVDYLLGRTPSSRPPPCSADQFAYSLPDGASTGELELARRLWKDVEKRKLDD